MNPCQRCTRKKSKRPKRRTHAAHAPKQKNNGDSELIDAFKNQIQHETGTDVNLIIGDPSDSSDSISAAAGDVWVCIPSAAGSCSEATECPEIAIIQEITEPTCINGRQNAFRSEYD